MQVHPSLQNLFDAANASSTLSALEQLSVLVSPLKEKDHEIERLHAILISKDHDIQTLKSRLLELSTRYTQEKDSWNKKIEYEHKTLQQWKDEVARLNRLFKQKQSSSPPQPTVMISLGKPNTTVPLGKSQPNTTIPLGKKKQHLTFEAKNPEKRKRIERIGVVAEIEDLPLPEIKGLIRLGTEKKVSLWLIYFL